MARTPSTAPKRVAVTVRVSQEVADALTDYRFDQRIEKTELNNHLGDILTAALEQRGVKAKTSPESSGVDAGK